MQHFERIKYKSGEYKLLGVIVLLATVATVGHQSADT